MKNVYKLGIGLLACLSVYAQDTATNSYTQTNLVSDIAGAPHTDPHLKNPWGLSRSAGSYWWVSDNVTGVTTLYDGSGNVQSLVVTIPPASSPGTGSPTGTVFVNGSFVFVTLDGTIQQWNGGPSTVIELKKSGAVYTGCTAALNGTVETIYVANSAGGVEAYTTAYAPATLTGTFTDPNLPAGYTPYGIQAVGSKIYVTFAPAAGGPGHGWVDAFDTNGNLLRRMERGKFLNQPWGIALAPASFGKFSKALLVGNLGSGKIDAFNPSTGKFVGTLHDASGKPIVISGLWALYFGGGNSLSGPTTSLYFAAGINGYADGLFGTIKAN